MFTPNNCQLPSQNIGNRGNKGNTFILYTLIPLYPLKPKGVRLDTILKIYHQSQKIGID